MCACVHIFVSCQPERGKKLAEKSSWPLHDIEKYFSGVGSMKWGKTAGFCSLFAHITLSYKGPLYKKSPLTAANAAFTTLNLYRFGFLFLPRYLYLWRLGGCLAFLLSLLCLQTPLSSRTVCTKARVCVLVFSPKDAQVFDI